MWQKTKRFKRIALQATQNKPFEKGNQTLFSGIPALFGDLTCSPVLVLMYILGCAWWCEIRRSGRGRRKSRSLSRPRQERYTAFWCDVVGVTPSSITQDVCPENESSGRILAFALNSSDFQGIMRTFLSAHIEYKANTAPPKEEDVLLGSCLVAAHFLCKFRFLG